MERSIVKIPINYFLGNIYIQALIVSCYRCCIMQLKIPVQKDSLLLG